MGKLACVSRMKSERADWLTVPKEGRISGTWPKRRLPSAAAKTSKRATRKNMSKAVGSTRTKERRERRTERDHETKRSGRRSGLR